MMGETEPNGTAQTTSNVDEPTETVKFGARAHFVIPQIIGRKSRLGSRIISHAIMGPVPFTSMELKSIAYDLNEANISENSVLNAQMRIKSAIRTLDEERNSNR